MRILIIGGISNSLINFRGSLIQAMLEQGHEVLACAGEPEQVVSETLSEWGVRFFPVTLARAGMRAGEDLQTFFELRRIMNNLRPDVVLAYTIKPVIWGALAARSAKIKNVYSLITGLGYAFRGGNSAKQLLAGWVAKRLYNVSLKHSRKVFFQNPDDLSLFSKLCLVKSDQAVLVNGSGVDLDYFGFSPLPLRVVSEMVKRADKSTSHTMGASHLCASYVKEENTSCTKDYTPVRFLLIARLLRDKGICEYAAAAAIVRQTYPQTEFHLVGDYDPNPAGLKVVEIEEWTKNGLIIFHGRQNDVRSFLRKAHVYVLPSYYREGTPRTVLEAMATGRPIITTDAPGCRETVKLITTKSLTQKKNNEAVMEGENGFLVCPRDAAAVATAMSKFLNNPELISRMGHRSREIAEERYDVHKVNVMLLESMGLNRASISDLKTPRPHSRQVSI